MEGVPGRDVRVPSEHQGADDVAKRKLTAEKQADRALCPVQVSHLLGLKVHEVARAMRAHGITQALQTAQARQWRQNPGSAPAWLTTLLTEVTVRAAQLQARRERGALEDEHRQLLLRDTVERRLLAGEHIPPGYDAELIVQDIAFTASKELVRGCGPVCGGPVADVLLPVEEAALYWAGVDPDDHGTWVVHCGDCPDVADEPSPWD
ncbi:hypothetical protein OG758_11880 [Streptomyces sp. NBC_01474]|uniref:hypothetical protein n=1 Tax=Streptomyces sp. NBC_01474 TaxID=2903880 RepID=UPI002DDA1FD7|nr:hypothetical protein [Streptomyces sp. NBC_01474]WSD94775.1 hypothetical protein OG758_11880 [Streptomyces sp. NBC_01474]